MKPKVGQKLKVIKPDYDLAVGQIVEVIDSGDYESLREFWTNGSAKYPSGLCFHESDISNFEIIEDTPSTTTPGEAEKREVEAINDLLFQTPPAFAVKRLVRVLVANGTLTLDQVKRTLGDQ